jgi:hypothetical protein
MKSKGVLILRTISRHNQKTDTTAQLYCTLSTYVIDRNCDVLPLLKFCKNKPILASLLRQFFLGGGKGVFCPKKGCNALFAGYYGFLRKKILRKLHTCIVSYCKYDMYFNKYVMYSIVGIDKKTYGEGIGIT